MNKLLSTIAAVALLLGAAGVSAKAQTSVTFKNVKTSVTQASCFKIYYFYDAYGNLYYRASHRCFY